MLVFTCTLLLLYRYIVNLDLTVSAMFARKFFEQFTKANQLLLTGRENGTPASVQGVSHNEGKLE